MKLLKYGLGVMALSVLVGCGGESQSALTSKINLFDALPKDIAIKIVKGNGEKQLIEVGDPLCPACQSFAQNFKNSKELNNVTLYVYPYALRSHEKSPEINEKIMCSNDPAKAWEEWMIEKKLPEKNEKPNCKYDLEKYRKVGEIINLKATPTLIFINGEKIEGAPADMLALDNALTTLHEAATGKKMKKEASPNASEASQTKVEASNSKVEASSVK